MSIIVFTGPTLTQQQASQILDADFRPPARQGDIYLAALERPKAIALIDGYFQHIPAPWHKEILFAMSKGIHVFGAASMGAIRAAELEHFGMVGIGEIYQQYQAEILEDDDEVTVVHAPKELNYTNLSDAMVNIRATLQLAVKQQVIDQVQYQSLIETAKSIWYPQRTFEQLLEQSQQQLAADTQHALATFCRQHKIDLKQQDAIALLQYLNSNRPSLQSAKVVDYHFEYTDAWQNMIEQTEQLQLANNDALPLEDIYKQLKKQQRFDQYKQQAQARQFMLEQLKKQQGVATKQQKQQALIQLSLQQQCISNNQVDFVKLSQWFTEQRLSPAQFDRLVQNQALLSDIDQHYPNPDQAIIDLLRLDNQLGDLLNLIEGEQ